MEMEMEMERERERWSSDVCHKMNSLCRVLGLISWVCLVQCGVPILRQGLIGCGVPPKIQLA